LAHLSNNDARWHLERVMVPLTGATNAGMKPRREAASA
jgi:hypothetical protein